MGSILIELIHYVVWIYTLAIIIRAFISWVQPNPYNPIVQILYRLTEPVLSPIRRVLLKSIPNMGFDFSPLVAIILLQIFERILIKILLHFPI
jgi:YggT family protein